MAISGCEEWLYLAMRVAISVEFEHRVQIFKRTQNATTEDP